jgi:hypothetical protein
MTSQILFVQGGGPRVHDEWDHKLVESLEQHLGTSVRYPRMPNEDDPSNNDLREVAEDVRDAVHRL